MFETVDGSVNFPDLEARIGRFWQDRKIYEKSLEQRADCPRFVFYEGPPTANGMPHPGHCLTRAIKDLFPRYRTMRGYLCERKAGWDTHGLPVEVEVCKELGIHSKEEIEQYGVEPFIQKCQASVWRYMQEWERLTERLGFWLHLDEAYVTYHQSYVESVWWSLKNLFDRDLLYQGHKIVWWWAQGGTALSAGEVGQGYREVADPSVFVKFPLLDNDGNATNEALLVWTTTPWTLPSNQFVAVNPAIDYVRLFNEEAKEVLYVAADLADRILEKSGEPWHATGSSPISGAGLIGSRYKPPFDCYEHLYDREGTQSPTHGGAKQALAWRIIAGEFVTTDSGTGLVHIAPAFGEDDYRMLAYQQMEFVDEDGPELINCVGPDGKFTEEGPDFCRGRWVKECDKDIVRDLRHRGLLYHQEQYLHDYPFCWRAEEDPLIQYPRESWFIRTTTFKDRLLANNAKINWQPEHIRDGRFGNFLESNVDWALSRERYWGTPLPIWVCSETGQKEAVASYDELLAKPGATGTEAWQEAKAANPDLPEDLKVHKPYIDAVTYDSPFSTGATMHRVTEVIDCWYDSGAMPFAQWGYPQQGKENFEGQFPADFISEALDQTRGWFYSLLAISTLLFSEKNDSTNPQSAIGNPQYPFPHPYRNCVVLGLMLGEDGGKMSKSKRNYREPNEIFDRYGADALRWYFFANQPPWTSIRYSEQAIKESIPEFLLRFWNVYSFFVLYANIDEFQPAEELAQQGGQLTAEDLAGARSARAVGERSELDRWVIGELNRAVATVTKHMDAYDNYSACAQITEFVDALSNWYLRRSRNRFWNSAENDPHWTADKQQDKQDAYWTLYECLLTSSKLIAPFVPFLAEAIWQNLTGVFKAGAVESVHLCNYPHANTSLIDEQLSERMEQVREISSLGRSARMNAKLKVRQPLAKVEVILANSPHLSWLKDHDALIQDELNVKQVEYTTEADKYITYQVQPDFKRLGPRVGKQIPAVKQALLEADASQLLKEIESTGSVTLELKDGDVQLTKDDVQIRLQAKEGWAAAQGKLCVVVLSTELTESLIREGMANDLTRLINDRRKEIGCQYTDRIVVGIVTESDELKLAIEENREYIQSETLAVEIRFEPLDGTQPVDIEVSGRQAQLYVSVANESK